MHDLLTINLGGPGTIDHVINDTCAPGPLCPGQSAVVG
jgi:hypothetical protein